MSTSECSSWCWSKSPFTKQIKEFLKKLVRNGEICYQMLPAMFFFFFFLVLIIKRCNFYHLQILECVFHGSFFSSVKAN